METMAWYMQDGALKTFHGKKFNGENIEKEKSDDSRESSDN